MVQPVTHPIPAVTEEYALTTADVAVLLFGDRRLPRPLRRPADRRCRRGRRLPQGRRGGVRRRPGGGADPAAARRPARRGGRHTRPRRGARAPCGQWCGATGSADPRRDRARCSSARRSGTVSTGHCTARPSSTTPCCSTARRPACGSSRRWRCPACAPPSSPVEAAAPLGDRTGRPARHHGALVMRDGVPGAAGQAVDVLSAHRRLASGQAMIAGLAQTFGSR